MMGKILTAQIGDEIKSSEENCGKFPEKQKGYFRETTGTFDLLHIVDQIFKKNQARRKNVPIESIDNKMVYKWFHTL